MSRITRSKQGQSNGSSRTSKAPRALANVSSNAVNRHNRTNDSSKSTKKRIDTSSKQSERSNDTDASIDELGRRITRSMTLATTSKPEKSKDESSSTKNTNRRRARLDAPPDPSNMRVTRSMALRDKRLTASKISIDAIANIATYLAPNNEAMNVCLALGPKGARIVRRRYLMHDQCDHWSQSSTRFLFSALRSNMSKSRCEQVLVQWMRYNKKWRCFMLSTDYRFDAPFVKEDDNRSTFCLVPMFANPGVAVALQLTFLVNIHCLRSDFDVNGFYSIRLADDGTNEDSSRIHLALSAMLNDDVDTFDALAAHPSINLGSISRFGDEKSRLIQNSIVLEGKNSPHFLRTIANHRTNDVNASNLRTSDTPSLALTPLQWLLLNYGDTEMFESSPRWALEILLEAGADSSLAPEAQVPTPSDIARALAIMSVTEDDDDKIARNLEALTIMREWPASMKINGLARGFLARRLLATSSHAAAQR